MTLGEIEVEVISSRPDVRSSSVAIIPLKRMGTSKRRKTASV